MASWQPSFRIGKARGDLRGRIWYLTYQENGRRQRPRVGPILKEAKQLASQINSQLELGSPALLSFESLHLKDLQQRWFEHHEHVLRSSLQTINRYRTATEHLLRFLDKANAPHTTSHYRTVHAKQFVRYLRTIQVSPRRAPYHHHQRVVKMLSRIFVSPPGGKELCSER